MKQCHREHKKEEEEAADLLKGWEQIAGFLGQPFSVAERWAHEGMPVERKGRFVHASREKLSHWLGRESSGEPVHISSENIDLSSELKRGLSFARTTRKKQKSKAA
jgi:hypothetical protein